VRLADPARLDEAERIIASRLPAGLAAAQARRRAVERMLASPVQPGGALVGGGARRAFSQHGLDVGHRKAQEIGMLRALGVARRTVLALFLARR
jgi:hypothetical protein